MNFWKYHVNGNDFVLLHQQAELSVNQICKLCNRNKGIGADGILQIWIKNKEVYYRHYNQDGSEAAMCGNGIRCVGHWFMARRKLERCVVHVQQRTYQLRMSEGDFVTLVADIPKVLGRNRYNSGVEHVISKQFRGRKDANVDVVEYQDALHFKVRTIELGVGPTLSCGTGNIAAYYHGYRQKLLHRIAIVENPGGYNLMRYSSHHIYMSAVVHCVFYGQLMNMPDLEHQ